ncbi:MAG: succinate--CoA ligase subunit alpha [Spirochaetaceae bacterium]|nr:MAG: succinate--CoA ligase subunit alpha [Spirochaetaceae bacterium]
MSILIDENTNVIVQGITGRDGSFHARQMLADGTKIVGGVTPGKGGQHLDSMPVYSSVKDAMAAGRVDATVIFVPERFAEAAVREAADAGVPLIAWITEGVPVIDVLNVYHYVKERGIRLIGPNCPGLISPGKCKIGIMPYRIHKEGNIGVISRSGTLTYEVVYNLTTSGLGQSTCVGIGGDPIVGSSFIDILELFEKDPGTEGIVVIGEIGGEDEEAAAEYIKQHVTKPVVAFISGRTAPPGKRMGHAGAIISGGKGTPEGKVKAFESVGVPVADKPDEIPGLLKKKFGI